LPRGGIFRLGRGLGEIYEGLVVILGGSARIAVCGFHLRQCFVCVTRLQGKPLEPTRRGVLMDESEGFLIRLGSFFIVVFIHHFPCRPGRAVAERFENARAKRRACPLAEKSEVFPAYGRGISRLSLANTFKERIE